MIAPGSGSRLVLRAKRSNRPTNPKSWRSIASATQEKRTDKKEKAPMRSTSKPFGLRE